MSIDIVALIVVVCILMASTIILAWRALVEQKRACIRQRAALLAYTPREPGFRLVLLRAMLRRCRTPRMARSVTAGGAER